MPPNSYHSPEPRKLQFTLRRLLLAMAAVSVLMAIGMDINRRFRTGEMVSESVILSAEISLLTGIFVASAEACWRSVSGQKGKASWYGNASVLLVIAAVYLALIFVPGFSYARNGTPFLEFRLAATIVATWTAVGLSILCAVAWGRLRRQGR